MAEIKNHRLIINRKNTEKEESLFKKLSSNYFTNKREGIRESRREKKEARRERRMERLKYKYGIGGIIIPIKPKHDRRLLLIKRLRLAA